MKATEDLKLLQQFTTKEGLPFQVPLAGSLGLLAYGDLGLMAWRLKKQTSLKAQKHEE